MAKSVSGRLPTIGNVIYDSRNDTGTGKKGAGITGGGLSVAERARLFGTQVKLSSSKNQQAQRPLLKQQSKSNIAHQDRDSQQLNTNVDRRQKKDLSDSTPQKVSNNYRPPTRVNNETKREQPSSTSSHHSSTVTQPTKRQIPLPHDDNRHSAIHHQRPSSYDSFQHPVPPSQQAFGKANYTQIAPGELYTVNGHPSLELYDRQRSPSYQTTYQTSNNVRPIQDPLELLVKDSSERYRQQHIPITTRTDLNGIQPFDLGNLINRIQQDYLDNVRPYVSSVQFVQNNHLEYERSLADIGFITPAINRRGYTRQSDDIYHRQIPSRHYEYLDTNDFRSSEKMHRKQSFNDNRYSSINGRKQEARYHDQASSPIHILASSRKTDTRRQSDNLPAASIPKLPKPTVTSSSEEEEEEEEEKATRPSSQPEVSKPAQQNSSNVRLVTSSESLTVSEDDSQEHPSTTSIQPPVPKSVDEAIRAPITTKTQTPQPTELIRPALQNQTPSTIARAQTKKSESEDSETEKSESDSDSDSDDEDEKPKPLPAARPNQRETSGTPNTRSANTPQINGRRTNADNSTNQLPELSDSIQDFDPEDSEKSSSFTGRLKSIVNKFRRKNRTQYEL